jgi:flagellar biosynthesis/type III secretory pathway chaperone
MEQSEVMNTYLQMLNESLQKKMLVLNQIYELTKQQDSCFQDENSVIDVMERCVKEKEPLLQQLTKLDEGFDLVYSKIKQFVLENKKEHQAELLKLQNSISDITSLSIKIQSLEQGNKRKFELFLASKKNEIKQFKVSNRTASNYYKNMTGKPQGESYFIDKKK